MTTDPVARPRVAPAPVRRASTSMIVLAVVTFGGALLAALGLLAAGGVAFGQDRVGEAGAAAGAGAAITVVVLVIAGAFCWLAVQVRRGRSWARVVASVLLLVGSVVAALRVAQNLSADPVVIPVVTIVQLVLMAVALILLWAPEAARDYFRTGRVSV